MVVADAIAGENRLSFFECVLPLFWVLRYQHQNPVDPSGNEPRRIFACHRASVRCRHHGAVSVSLVVCDQSLL